MADVDAVIVGAGAVGLACGYTLSRRGASVIVLEKEPAIGAGVSARNSEVIHAGLHYPPGSLKARLCVEGRRLLYAFLDAHAVAYEKSGKLIVATEESERASLDALYARGAANGVEGLAMRTQEEARALEPTLRCVAAIESAESGVFDSHGYMAALQGEIEAHGGAVALNAPLIKAHRAGDYVISVGGAEPTTLTAHALVLAPGLSAQSVAHTIDNFPTHVIPPLHFGKGNYFALSGRAPFKRLIYPPPIPGALGMHYRRDLGGQARFGPDLHFVTEEDYRVDSTRAASFYAAIRRFWPDLPDDALTPDYAGIRPKLHGPGEAQGDFRIDGAERHGQKGLIALFGIESPGLTSSLAIGEHVGHLLEPHIA